MSTREATSVPAGASRWAAYHHAVAVAFGVVLVGATGAWAASPVTTVGPEEQVSVGNPLEKCTADDVPTQEIDGSVVFPSGEVEPYIDVNPTNPDNLIAVWQQDRWSDGGARALG